MKDSWFLRTVFTRKFQYTMGHMWGDLRGFSFRMPLPQGRWTLKRGDSRMHILNITMCTVFLIRTSNELSSSAGGFFRYPKNSWKIFPAVLLMHWDQQRN